MRFSQLGWISMLISAHPVMWVANRTDYVRPTKGVVRISVSHKSASRAPSIYPNQIPLTLI